MSNVWHSVCLHAGEQFGNGRCGYGLGEAQVKIRSKEAIEVI